MKNNMLDLRSEKSLLDIIEEHKEHLEENELVIQLNNGLCKIHLDPVSKKYQILVDTVDEIIDLTVDDFLYGNE